MVENVTKGGDEREQFRSGVVFVLLRGYPGSGKTVVAREVQKLWGNKIEVLDPDGLKDEEGYKNFLADLSEEEKHYAPYRYLLQKTASLLLVGKSVIWNQPWSEIFGMEYTLERLRQLTTGDKGRRSDYMPLVFEIGVAAEVALERLMMRKREGGHGPDEEKFWQMVESFESVRSVKGVSCVVLDGERSVGEIAKEVCSFLDK